MRIVRSWMYEPLRIELRNYAERPPRALHEALATHPDFFAEVVSMAYKADDAEPDQLPEAEVLHAHRTNAAARRRLPPRASGALPDLSM